MSRFSGNSLLSTLRGKIWISTSVLAFFICTFGLISYLVVTLLTNNPFYGVFIPFIFLAFTVIVFGWWLSNELVSPIDNIILLAKSLERNSATSLPKTSGSTETDQLLQTLHRNSRQMQNVITLMDKVAGGNIDVALSPLEGSDRLTASFQKLLAKVSESIQAKDELDKLEKEIKLVKNELSGVRNGNLNIELESEYVYTKEITEAIKYLIEKLTLLISIVKVDSIQAQGSANNVEKTIESLIQQDEKKIQKMNQASITLKQVPNIIEKITEDLTRSAKSAKHTIEKTRHGSDISNENSESVAKLRSNLRESIGRIQSLNERSHEIAKVAKIVDDLANRTNMIALNASIQATEFGEEGQSFVLVSEELERLAARANGTNKHISTLNNTILSEIGRVEDSLESTMGEVANLSKYTIETANVLGELERYIGQFLNLQENLITFSNYQSNETDEAFETFVSSITDTENNVQDLAESATQIKSISSMMKNLQSHIAEFRVIQQSDLQSSESENTPSFENQNEESGASPSIDNEEFTTDEFNRVKLSTEEFNVMKMKSEQTNAENSESGEFDSADLKTEDSSQNKLNSEDLDSEELQADKTDIDPEKLYDEQFKSFENDEDKGLDMNSDNFNSVEFLNEKFASDEFDSGEFVQDDFDIEQENLSKAEEEISGSLTKNSFDDDDDDLLDLKSKSAVNDAPNIPV